MQIFIVVEKGERENLDLLSLVSFQQLYQLHMFALLCSFYLKAANGNRNKKYLHLVLGVDTHSIDHICGDQGPQLQIQILKKSSKSAYNYPFY